MIDLSKMSAEEFNTLLAAPIGNFIKVEFAIAAGHLAVITGVQITNTDTVPHDFELQYQGSGFVGALATFVTLTVNSGVSRLLIPADTQPGVEPLITGPFVFVGPCTLTIQGLTALVTLTSMSFKINWLEGISIADISGAVAPAITSAP